MMCVGRRIIDRVTYKDYPERSPCNACGTAIWNRCYADSKACNELWDFLAKRGNWVMEQNE